MNNENKSEKLYNAIGKIDDSFVTQADKKPDKRKFIMIAALSAACIVIIAALSTMAFKAVFDKSLPQSSAVQFKSGVQTVALKECNIQESGVQGLEEILRNYISMPPKLNVAYFSSEISKDGIIKNYSLSLNSFDNSNQYKGMYSFKYDYKTKQMEFTAPKEAGASVLPVIYNENYDVSYFSQQQKRIPLIKQISMLNFDRYVLQFQSDTQIQKDTPIIDASSGEEIPVLTMKDYTAKKGGVSDGKTGIYFTLYDGVSIVSKNLINYKLAPYNKESLGTTKSNVMKHDYYINNNKMKITRDYGETWVDVDIPDADMTETLDFYASSTSIPENSYYISDNPGGIIAVLYGETPKLRISCDDGKSWQTIELKVYDDPDYRLPITNRVIGFTDDKNGYIALGSGFTMGSGELKYAYYTNNKGLTWNRKELPMPCSSHTLTGMYFCDEKSGVLTLAGDSESPVPDFYYTINGGKSWTQAKLPEDEVLENVESVLMVDSLSFRDGVYTLICGKGSDESTKVKLQSSKLGGEWKYIESYKAVTHTVG